MQNLSTFVLGGYFGAQMLLPSPKIKRASLPIHGDFPKGVWGLCVIICAGSLVDGVTSSGNGHQMVHNGGQVAPQSSLTPSTAQLLGGFLAKKCSNLKKGKLHVFLATKSCQWKHQLTTIFFCCSTLCSQFFSLKYVSLSCVTCTTVKGCKLKDDMHVAFLSIVSTKVEKEVLLN